MLYSTSTYLFVLLFFSSSDIQPRFVDPQLIHAKMFFQTVRYACKTMLPQLSAVPNKSTLMASVMTSRSFHLLSSSVASRLQTNILAATSTLLPAPTLPQLTQTCGMKQKGILRRRCKACYFVRREGRLYNMCPAHPRHKQQQMMKSPKNSWILTHATQSKVRPW